MTVQDDNQGELNLEDVRPEFSSAEMGKLAGRALRWPGKITQDEIRALAGSVLTQVQDRKTEHRPVATTITLAGREWRVTFKPEERP